MEYTYIYGAIMIDRDYLGTVSFLRSLEKDNSYPFINANMFSYGDYEIPFYYETPIITFGATYKWFGLDKEDWDLFILKVEHILRHTDFEMAQFHFGAALGEYTLFWMNKKKMRPTQMGWAQEEESKLIEAKEWYFGYGARDLNVGFLLKDQDRFDIPEPRIIYPVRADSKVLEQFDEFKSRVKG